MKKKIAYILVAALIIIAGIGLGVSAFNNMNSEKPNTEVQGDGNEDNISDEDLMKKAVAYVKTIYKDVAKETPNDFERIGTVPVGKVKFNVEWSVDVDESIIKIVKQENGLVLIDINEEVGDETPYVLTATITDGKGNSKTLTWEHVIPAKITGSYQEIVDMAYALKNGESLPNIATLQGTVTTVNTAWDPGYKNITVTIVVEGREDKPIQCYRLKSGAADASTIEKGDLITVTGTLKNYNGTIEFDAGCTLDAIEKGAGTIEKVTGTMQEIVDKAYALGKGEALKGEATLTGWVKSIDTPYSDQYKNITVTIVVEGRLDKPIVCYRLKGDGAQNIKVGDIITVTGNIKNYNGTIEFDAGCTLDKLEKGDGKAPETPVMSGTMQEIVDKAYKLAPGESFTEDAVLTGKIIKVNTPWSSDFKNITVTIAVEGREDKPIKCYRLTGTNADKIAKGDTITVKGIITNYLGTDKDTGETWTEVEFKQGCQLIDWKQGVYVPPVIEDIDAPFKTGDKVVIWNPAYNKAFTTETAASYYSAGADVTYTNGVLRNYPASAIFEIVENSDKTYSFKQNGQTLGMADEYSSILLGSAHDKWIITETEDGKYRIMNMKREAYMEWYDAKDYWSGYGTISGKFFDLDIYVIPDEVPPATLEDAVAKLQSDYAAEMTKNGEYALVPIINVDGTEFNVTWAIESEDEAVANIVDGKLVIVASTEKDVAYTLKATVSDKTGSKVVTWTYTVAKVALPSEDDGNEKAPTKGIFTMYQGNVDKTLYLNGEMDGYYFGTTENIAEAVKVGTEEAEGGVYLYIVKDGVKSYIDIYKSGTYTNVGYKEAPAAVFVYNEEYDTYLTNVEGTNYFLGTRNDKSYTTFSACAEKYLATNFIGHIKEVAIPYKLSMYQGNLDTTLYFTGAMDGYYLGSTEDVAEAVDMYIEEVEGGVQFYFMNGEEKAYIDIYVNGTYTNIGFETGNASVFTYDEESGAYLTQVGEKQFFIGTRGDKSYKTFSACESKYLGDNFIAVFELSATGEYKDVVIEEEPDTPDVPTPGVTVADAVAKLTEKMADANMFNATDDYTLEATIVVEDVTYNVTWKVSPEGILYASIVNGNTLHVEADVNEDKEFELVATVTNAANAEDTATQTYGPYTVLKVEEPEVPESNEKAPAKGIFTMYQGNVDKTLYLNGEMDGYYFGTTEDIAAAVEVGTEEAEGGVYLYIVKDGVKSYIDIYKSGTYTNVGYKEAPAAVFVYNEEYDTYLTNVEGTNYFLGTRNDREFTTFSACAEKYLATNFIGHIEKIAIPYKLSMYQGNLDKTLYFAGTMDGYYLGSTEDAATAVDMYIEEVEGGVVFYFMNGEEKAYIDIYASGTYTNIGYETGNAAVFTFDEELNTYVTQVGEKYFFIGTRGDKSYKTFSACETKYIDSNFVAIFEAKEDAGDDVVPPTEEEPDTPVVPDEPVVPDTPAEDKKEVFVKVTEDQEDWSGEYLIVYEESNKAFKGSKNDASNMKKDNAFDVTVENNQIEATDELKADSVIITKVDGGYTIQLASGLYIGAVSDSNSVAATENASEAYIHTITYDVEKAIVNLMHNPGDKDRFLHYNSKSDFFRYYGSSSNQQAITLYKLVEE